MNLRTIRIALSLGSYLLVSTPKRVKLRKLAKTDPIEAARLSHEEIHHEIETLWKITVRGTFLAGSAGYGNKLKF